MKDFYEYDQGDGDLWPQYEAECQGCDTWGPVDDIGLCQDCAGKLERDMIRQRDWAYSALAFGCPKDKLEDLRNEVIKKYGEKLELIAEERPTGNKSENNRRRNCKRNRKKR
jgi:hypothetical protein